MYSLLLFRNQVLRSHQRRKRRQPWVLNLNFREKHLNLENNLLEKDENLYDDQNSKFCDLVLSKVQRRVKRLLKKKHGFFFHRRAFSPLIRRSNENCTLWPKISTREMLMKEWGFETKWNPLEKMFKIQDSIRQKSSL